MVDFAAHFTIHAKNRISKNTTFYLESVVLESHSSTNSLPKCRYFYLDGISDSFAIHRSSSTTLLAAEKRFGVA